MKFSIIIPVYKNEESIPRLLSALSDMYRQLDGALEAVFVVDGSPDQSYALLRAALDSMGMPAQLLAHSRNFGSFPAIRTGLIAARGIYFGVMAADLQEPPELLVELFRSLDADECDVAIGTRVSRRDPFFSRMASGLFWWLYRRLVVPDMPEGGVDVFGCNRIFREQLLKLEESRSSLIALIFWLGFRRKLIGYERLGRLEGKTAWTFRKKLDYMMDSIFAFTDSPIRFLTKIGVGGFLISSVMGSVVVIGRITNTIQTPGYATIMILTMFFGTLNLFGLGLVGTYAWRGYENSKKRPHAVISVQQTNSINSYEE